MQKGAFTVATIALKFGYDLHKSGDLKKGYEATKAKVKETWDKHRPKSKAFKNGMILEQEPESLKDTKVRL